MAVSGRTPEKVEFVVREIESEGGTAFAMKCDVNVRAEMEGLVQATVDRYGPPDILVNNAQGGGGGERLLDSIDDEVFLAAYQGGPLATLYGMQACFPRMKERGGTIVNMGSSTGVMGDPGFAPYGSAKEAIRGLTKHAAREWGRYGITVNVICPAAISAEAQQFRGEAPKQWAAIIKQVPLGYLGDPENDIAPAVVALATDLHYLTGATLMLDGGRCLLR
ncbi:SDR family oxidoreductase [Streptomyces chlorus]